MAEVLKLYSGNDWVFDIQAYDVPALGADPSAPLPPFDLRGCTLYLTLKASVGDVDPGAVSHSQVVGTSAEAAVGLERLLVPNAKTRIAGGTFKAQIVAVRPGAPNYIITLDDQPIVVRPRLMQVLPS